MRNGKMVASVARDPLRRADAAGHVLNHKDPPPAKELTA